MKSCQFEKVKKENWIQIKPYYMHMKILVVKNLLPIELSEKFSNFFLH